MLNDSSKYHFSNISKIWIYSFRNLQTISNFPKIHILFRTVLCSFQIFVNIPDIFVLFISYRIGLWTETIICITFWMF